MSSFPLISEKTDMADEMSVSVDIDIILIFHAGAVCPYVIGCILPQSY
jgi:hypothetical protein